MARYVALLRGVSPMNAKMPDVKRAFEAAGFTNVKTLLSSGNVAFDARKAATDSLQRKAEAAMEAHLPQGFLAIVRSQEDLQALLASDPYAKAKLPGNAKKVVTFLREPAGDVQLPAEVHGARIVAVQGGEVFSAYVPGDKGPVFMTLIEKTFGKAVTTRTWETVTKCAKA